jgi:mannosyltransferase
LQNEASHVHGAQDEGEGSSWLSECFASWLADIHGNSLSPTFEIGSLSFFRSLNHFAFFDHLDNAGDFQFRRVDDAPLHSLSANMFLPRESVWNFRTMETKLRSQNDGEDTRAERQYSEKCMNNFDNSNLNGSAKLKGDAHEAMAALLKAWDLMARDVGVQSKSPKLISGNTWMGKMNGGAGCSFFWFWRKTLSGDLGFGWEVDLSCLHDGMKGQVKIKV